MARTNTRITPLQVTEINLETVNRVVAELNSAYEVVDQLLARLEARDGMRPEFMGDLDMQEHRVMNVGDAQRDQHTITRRVLRNGSLTARGAEVFRASRNIVAQRGLQVPRAQTGSDAVPLRQLRTSVIDAVAALVATVAPPSVQANSALGAVTARLAREDHTHGISAVLATVAPPAVAAASAVGVSTVRLAREDHTHAGAAAGVVAPGDPLHVTRHNAAGTGVESTTQLYTDAAGTQLGIGAAPSTFHALQVQGAMLARQGNLQMERDDGADAILGTQVHSNTAGNAPTIQTTRGGGTLATPTQTLTGQRLWTVRNRGHLGAGGVPDFSNEIIAEAAQDYATGLQGSRLRFLTTLLGTGAGARAERLRIHDNGYVGVSHTSPRFPLHVTGRLAHGVPNSAPTDADLGNGEGTAYLDETTNRLVWRTRWSTGALHSYGLDEGVASTFTLTPVGFSPALPAVTVNYWQRGLLVVLSIPEVTGTSNAAQFSLTGLPTALRPPARLPFWPVIVRVATTQQLGHMIIRSGGGGQVDLAPTADSTTTWPTSGTKTLAACQVSYMLI